MASPDLAPKRARTKTLAKKGATAPVARTEAVSTGTLVKEALGDALSVLEAHLELAVLEVREDARVAVQVATTFGIGAALTFLAAGFVLSAAAFGLALVVPAWAACLIVGSVASVAALIAIVAGYKKYKNHDFRPERSIEVAQENNPWKAERTS
jgi:uncharacterized membrane protein YqjE